MGVIGNPREYGWYREWAAAAERAGFSLLTTGDSPSLWADPFVTLSVAAAVTARPRLAVTVSNPLVRHPAAVASALAALDRLAPGRIVYGVGSGDSALRNIGLTPAKVAEVAEFVQAVKDLCAGRGVTWRGARLIPQWSAFELPVWVAAEGPRMQAVAGRIADGVLLSNALDAEVLSQSRANLEEGASAAGRAVDDIEVWCLAAMCFASSEEEGVFRMRSLLAGTANHVYRFHMEGKSVPPELRSAIKELQARYDSSHHASPATAEANAHLVEELGLVDFLAARSVIAGPPARCLERIGELTALGADRLLVHHHANEPQEFMATFAAEMAPHLELGR